MTRFIQLLKRKSVLSATLLGLIAASMPARAALWENFNTGAVTNVPVTPAGVFTPTRVTLTATATVTQLATYHYNGGAGAPAVSITITAVPDNLFSNNIHFSGTYAAQNYDA